MCFTKIGDPVKGLQKKSRSSAGTSTYNKAYEQPSENGSNDSGWLNKFHFLNKCKA